MHKERRQSTWIDYAVFSVVVCFFFFSAKSIWKNPPRFKQSPQLKNELKEAGPQRGPAAAKNETNANGNAQTLHLGCLNKSKEKLRFESMATYMSVVAEICNTSEQKNLQRSVFKNEATQDEILAFIEPGSSRIKTSYFPLVVGENKISFELYSKKGVLLRHSLEIIRNSESK